ncbi:MAG: HAD-IA family hydrolase [Isosphaeraceae bacterium]
MRAMIGRRAVDAGNAFRTMAGLEGRSRCSWPVRSRFYAEMDAVHPTPGLIVLLDHLERLEIPRAVATSSRRPYAEGLLTRHGLIGHFQFLLCGDDVTHGKPHPEVYLTAARRFGLPPRSLLVLEDSPAGIAAARAAGAFAVGVPHEHSPAEGLSEANLIVDRLDAPALLARVRRVEPI